MRLDWRTNGQEERIIEDGIRHKSECSLCQDLYESTHTATIYGHIYGGAWYAWPRGRGVVPWHLPCVHES